MAMEICARLSETIHADTGLSPAAFITILLLSLMVGAYLLAYFFFHPDSITATEKSVVASASPAPANQSPSALLVVIKAAEISRALALMSYFPNDFTDNLDGSGLDELEALKDWGENFKGRCVKVGRVFRSFLLETRLITLILLIWVQLVASNTDLDALLEFKNEFGKDPSGQIFSTWNPSNPPDSPNCPTNWHGVQCSAGQVISLYLDGIGLTGNVSLSPLSKISTLQNLSLSNNHLTGLVPSEITKLTNLVYLNLSLNNFTGDFPSGLQNLHKLRYLDLHDNFISGKVDDIFAQLHSPTYIDLSNNLFSGSLKPISDSSAIINSVVHLNVSYNQLSGAIFGEEPAPLFDALEHFDASFNQFSGNVPSFNFIVSLKILRLRCNQFNGSIPEALFKETSLVLTELDLSCNQLKGN
jgi:Leucine rich repeat/Leucine rich repeat N-terminal domain/Leucine Rich repeat